MKKFIKITKAVIVKAAALIAWPALTVFNLMLKLFTHVFRFVAVPTVFFGLLVTAVTFFDNGYSRSMLTALGTFSTITALYFLLPMVPSLIESTQGRVKNVAFAPIVVRSPVKFTI